MLASRSTPALAEAALISPVWLLDGHGEPLQTMLRHCIGQDAGCCESPAAPSGGRQCKASGRCYPPDGSLLGSNPAPLSSPQEQGPRWRLPSPSVPTSWPGRSSPMLEGPDRVRTAQYLVLPRDGDTASGKLGIEVIVCLVQVDALDS